MLENYARLLYLKFAMIFIAVIDVTVIFIWLTAIVVTLPVDV